LICDRLNQFKIKTTKMGF